MIMGYHIFKFSINILILTFCSIIIFGCITIINTLIEGSPYHSIEFFSLRTAFILCITTLITFGIKNTSSNKCKKCLNKIK